MDAENLVLILGGVASLAGVVLPAVRKRQDVDVEEKDRRIADLTTRLTAEEAANTDLRGQLVQCEKNEFAYRRALVQNGLDPSEVVSS